MLAQRIQTACYVEYISAAQKLVVQQWIMEDNYIIECRLSQQTENVKWACQKNNLQTN